MGTPRHSLCSSHRWVVSLRAQGRATGSRLSQTHICATASLSTTHTTRPSPLAAVTARAYGPCNRLISPDFCRHGPWASRSAGLIVACFPLLLDQIPHCLCILRVAAPDREEWPPPRRPPGLDWQTNPSNDHLDLEALERCCGRLCVLGTSHMVARASVSRRVDSPLGDTQRPLHLHNSLSVFDSLLQSGVFGCWLLVLQVLGLGIARG